MISRTTRITSLSGAIAGAAVVYLALFAAHVAVTAARTVEAGPNTAPAGSYGTYTVAGESDWFHIWDFDDASLGQTKVDWPIRFVYTDQASINYVKNRLDGKGGDPTINPDLEDAGGTQWGYMEDNDPWASNWDGDGGIKEDINSCSLGRWDWGHQRFYANNFNDYNFNPSWGQWIIGSNHIDYEGGGCSHAFMSRETEEDKWAVRLNVVAGSHNWSWQDYYNYLDNGGYSCASGYTNIATNPMTDPPHYYCGNGYPVRVWVD